MNPRLFNSWVVVFSCPTPRVKEHFAELKLHIVYLCHIKETFQFVFILIDLCLCVWGFDFSSQVREIPARRAVDLLVIGWICKHIGLTLKKSIESPSFSPQRLNNLQNIPPLSVSPSSFCAVRMPLASTWPRDKRSETLYSKFPVCVFAAGLFTRLSLIPKWDIHHLKKINKKRCTLPWQNGFCGLSPNVWVKSRPLLMKRVCTAYNHCLLTFLLHNEHVRNEDLVFVLITGILLFTFWWASLCCLWQLRPH